MYRFFVAEELRYMTVLEPDLEPVCNLLCFRTGQREKEEGVGVKRKKTVPAV